MSERMTLPARLDLPASESLCAGLIAARGQDVTLEAADVEHLGAHAAQTLLIARASWTADGKTFSIDAPSQAMRNDWAALGLPPADLAEQELP